MNGGEGVHFRVSQMNKKDHWGYILYRLHSTVEVWSPKDSENGTPDQNSRDPYKKYCNPYLEALYDP